MSDIKKYSNKLKYRAVKEYLKEKGNYRSIAAKSNQPELKTYIFIIDEINRGEISKIFGELFFAIDPGYRGDGIPPAFYGTGPVFLSLAVTLVVDRVDFLHGILARILSLYGQVNQGKSSNN